MRKIIKIVMTLTFILISIQVTNVNKVNAGDLIIDVDAIAPDGVVTVQDGIISGSLGTVNYVSSTTNPVDPDGLNFEYSGSILTLTLNTGDMKYIKTNSDTEIKSDNPSLTLDTQAYNTGSIFIDGDLIVNPGLTLIINGLNYALMVSGDFTLLGKLYLDSRGTNTEGLDKLKDYSTLSVGGSLSTTYTSLINIEKFDDNTNINSYVADMYIGNEWRSFKTSYSLHNYEKELSQHIYGVYVKNGPIFLDDTYVNYQNSARAGVGIYLENSADLTAINISSFVLSGVNAGIILAGEESNLLLDNSYIHIYSHAREYKSVEVAGDIILDNESVIGLDIRDSDVVRKKLDEVSARSIQLLTPLDKFNMNFNIQNDPLLLNIDHPSIDFAAIGDVTNYIWDIYAPVTPYSPNVLTPSWTMKLAAGGYIDNVSNDPNGIFSGVGYAEITFDVIMTEYLNSFFYTYDPVTNTYTLEERVPLNVGEVAVDPTPASFPGYAFVGWTSQDLSLNTLPEVGVVETLIPLNSDAVYYAVYAVAPDIILNTNGGVADASVLSSLLPDDALTMLPTPTRDGYTFTGWYAYEDLSGSVYINQSTYDATLQSTNNLYAGWIQDSVPELELAKTGSTNYFVFSIISALLLFVVRKFLKYNNV